MDYENKTKCKWCGHGDRLDRGTVKSISYWLEGEHREMEEQGIEGQPHYHGGCFTAMREFEDRQAKSRIGKRRGR